MLLNYFNVHDDDLRDRSPAFEQICLPGMSEAFKLHVFLHIDDETNLRFAFVCEENNQQIKKELHGFCLSLLKDFKMKKIPEAIDISESDMFSRISKDHYNIFNFFDIDMNEVQNVLICNTALEQFTCYNLPIIYPEEMLPAQVRAV